MTRIEGMTAAAIIGVIIAVLSMHLGSSNYHNQIRAESLYCAVAVARLCRDAKVRAQCEKITEQRGCCAYENRRTGEIEKFDLCSSRK